MKLKNVFKREEDLREPLFDKPSKNDIIDEIHDTFYTEVDRLLADAKVTRPTDTTKQALIDKVEKLKSLGFTNTRECKEAEVELKRISEIVMENKTKGSLERAINYFSSKYPNYKFITQESVKKICTKYGLVYGDVSTYIGEVPEKNLQHILDFKIDEDDKCFIGTTHRPFGGTPKITYLNRKEFDEGKNSSMHTRSIYDDVVLYTMCSLEIAAPVKDFNMERKQIVDSRIMDIPDPVVLQPVIFEGAKYYLIVTAWGQEASDGLVVNQRMN